MNNVKVRAGAILEQVIIDKHTEIGARSRLGGVAPCPPNEALSDTHTCGAVVIGRECVLPPKSDVGGNTQIAPGTEREWPFVLAAGASLDTPEVHG